jgi:VanZ family protein
MLHHMPRLPKHPAPWFSALAFWIGLLWLLSSIPGANRGPEIDHIDKVAHFGYFFGGGLLFAGCLLSLSRKAPDWRKIIGFTVLAMAIIGFLDEWHQTFTPGRSGADPWDWLADLLGGTAGAFFLKSLHRRLS